MLNRAHGALREHRVTVYTAAVLCLLFFHMLWYVNFYLAESLAGTYFTYLIPVLTAFYLYFRGLRDGPEILITLLFSLWLLITRALNGDPTLVREGYLVIYSLMMTIFLSVGPVLSKSGRRTCLNVVSAAAGVFFFALSLLGLYAFITRTSVINPLTEAVTTPVIRKSAKGFVRLMLLGVNPNTTALWFYLSACLMAYQFFACRNKWWRVPILVCALADHLMVAACGSRNVKLAFALSFALLLCVVAARELREKSRGLRALAATLILLAAVPIGYLSFDAAALAMGRLSAAQEEKLEAAPQSARAEDRASPRPLSAEDRESRPEPLSAADPRGVFEDSGRLKIYRAALESLRQQPQRLWKGCLFEERMSVADEVLKRQFPSFHNTFLDVLNLTGIPGLLLLLGFLILLLRRCVLLLFSPSAPVAEKLLVLPIVGALEYGMLEPLWFFCYDFRALLVFLLAGFVIACAGEQEKTPS